MTRTEAAKALVKRKPALRKSIAQIEKEPVVIVDCPAVVSIEKENGRLRVKFEKADSLDATPPNGVS